MSVPPKTFTLNREDFPQAGWVDRLLRPLNGFVAEVCAGLSSLTRRENMLSQVEEVTFTASGAGALSEPIIFPVKFAGKPTMVWVAFAYCVTTPTDTFSAAVFPTWEPVNDPSGTKVKIRSLTGLSASKKYTVRFVVE